MKRASTFFRQKSRLTYDLSASIREIVSAITKLTGSGVIRLSDYCGFVLAPITTICVNKELFLYEVGRIDYLTYSEITARSENAVCTAQPYDYPVDTLETLYWALESIYRVVKETHKKAELALADSKSY